MGKTACSGGETNAPVAVADVSPTCRSTTAVYMSTASHATMAMQSHAFAPRAGHEMQLAVKYALAPVRIARRLWYESPVRVCLLMYKESLGWSQAASATMPIILLRVASQKRKQPSPPQTRTAVVALPRLATMELDASCRASASATSRIALGTTSSSTTSMLSLVIAGFSAAPAVGCCGLNLIVLQSRC